MPASHTDLRKLVERLCGDLPRVTVALAICSLAIGILVGLRFRVMALVPLNVLIVGAVTAFNISQQSAILTMAIDGTIAVIAVELGYVCGAALRFLLPPRCAGACWVQSVAPDNDDGQ
jgi:hypothetical protein